MRRLWGRFVWASFSAALLCGDLFAADVEEESDPREKEKVFNVQKALEDGGVKDPGWPREWKVFGPIPAGVEKLPGERLKVLPDKLEVGGREYAPQTRGTEKYWVELLPLLGLKPSANRRDFPVGHQAYAMAEWDCPEDGTLFLNVSSFYWMEWYLDGKEIFSTLETGNRAPPELLSKQWLSLPVTRGRHVVAALVRSSRWGWRFASVAGLTGRPAAELEKYFEPRIVVLASQPPPEQIETPGLPDAPPVTDTEADRILAEAKALERFAGYQPRFKVRKVWVLAEASKSRQEFRRKLQWQVFDGDRRVASFWDGLFRLSQYEFNPADPFNTEAARETLGYPQYVNLLLGAIFKLDASRIPCKHLCRWCVAPDGGRVTLQQDWIPEKGEFERMRTTTTLRVDPRCGYVVDSLAEFTAPTVTAAMWPAKEGEAFEGNEFCNVMPGHLIEYVTPGAYNWRYERTLYTPRESDKYLGWICDTWQADVSDSQGLNLRKDGFVAFLSDPRGWSQLFSHNGAEDVLFWNATCWQLQDQHNHVRVPKPKGSGPHRVAISYRMQNFPPEGTAYLMDRMEMMLGEFVMVRQGRVRDFESDARDPRASAPWSPKVPVAEGIAHSGTKAVAFKAPFTFPWGSSGRSKVRLRRGKDGNVMLRIDVLPAPEANTRYRLELWAKLEGEGTRAWVNAEPPPWRPSNWIGPESQPTESANLESAADWQKLTFEFGTAAQHGWTPTVFFKAQLGKNGAVFLDDISVKARLTADAAMDEEAERVAVSPAPPKEGEPRP